MTSPSKDTGRVDETPFDLNEHGLWCPTCGYLIATNERLDEYDYTPPQECKQCGFPDFEDGMGYFTDED